MRIAAIIFLLATTPAVADWTLPSFGECLAFLTDLNRTGGGLKEPVDEIEVSADAFKAGDDFKGCSHLRMAIDGVQGVWTKLIRCDKPDAHDDTERKISEIARFQTPKVDELLTNLSNMAVKKACLHR